MKLVMLAAAFGLLAVPATTLDVTALAISPDQARSNVGQCMTVEGHAAMFHDPGSFGVDVDLGDSSGDTGFLAYVPNQNALPNLDSFDGHVVDVTGVVLLHEGRPAIQLTSPDQIAFADSSGRTPTCDDAS